MNFDELKDRKILYVNPITSDEKPDTIFMLEIALDDGTIVEITPTNYNYGNQELIVKID